MSCSASPSTYEYGIRVGRWCGVPELGVCGIDFAHIEAGITVLGLEVDELEQLQKNLPYRLTTRS